MLDDPNVPTYTESELKRQLAECQQKLDRFTRLAECGSSLGDELDLSEKLAECQAREARQVEALKIIALRPWHTQVRNIAEAILSLPQDDTALREAIAQALEALEEYSWKTIYRERTDQETHACCFVLSNQPHAKDCLATNAIAAIKAELAKPAPEPFTAMYEWLDNHGIEMLTDSPPSGTDYTEIPLYREPPPPEVPELKQEALGEPFQSILDEHRAELYEGVTVPTICKVNELSSRMCELGTKGCTVTHNEYQYAIKLATYLSSKYYDDVGWKPLPDLQGVLTQIDNMLTGLQRFRQFD